MRPNRTTLFWTSALSVCFLLSGSPNSTASEYFNGDGPGDVDVMEEQVASCGKMGTCECSPACGGCQPCCCQNQGFSCLNLIKPTDPCFGCFISPMTNPVFFEDPRNLTEVRFIYLHHKVPLTALGGDVNLVAAQIRAAITDRLSIVAAKDGFITSSNPLIEDGWADVSLGAKYTLFSDPFSQRILSAGVSYELPVGSTRAAQGNGDGLFNLYLTGGMEHRGWHWVSASGFLLPADTVDESQIWFWSNHFDHRLGNTNLYFLTEFNWYHWMKSGQNGVPGIEGGDLFNLGSTGVAGNDIVTGAIGLKWRPNYRREVGIAWEVPLTDRRDVLDNRLTVDLIFRY